MSDEIINFYKKSFTNDVDANEVIPDQGPVNEQIESKALDPFENFLQTLAVNIEKTKASEFSKTEEVINESTIEDPFAKFLTNVADIIKKDEKVQTDEQIKDATIGFINKLKDEPVIEEKPVIVKKQKNSYLPKKFIKKLPKKAIKETAIVNTEIPIIDLNTGLPESIQDVKEEVIPVTDDSTDNTYVKELKIIDKSKKIPDKVTKPGDIKALIEKQVREQVNKLRQELGQAAMTAGGGGTVAVQYADGGTMNGDLNVTGKYLSGGRDLATIFTGGGGGSSDRLISGTEQLVLNLDGSVTFPDNVIRPAEDTIITLESENTALSAFTRVALSPYAFFAYDVNSNSITFDSIDNSIVLTSQDQYEWTFNDKGELIGPGNVLTVNSTLSTLGRILSGGRDLADIFLTSETDSQTLTFNVSTLELSISNGNSVSLSALSSTDIPTDQLPINSIVVSNSANWNDAYTNLVTNSAAYLSSVDLSFLSVSGNWNEAYNNSTVYSNNSASYATINYVDGNFFSLSGGIVTGETHFDGNVTVFGNLTATGTTTFANTIFSVTSALSVVHVGGSGPAMYIGNDGTGDIASFYDIDQNIEVLHVGGINSLFPNVGVKTSAPNKTLTVVGEISSTSDITTSGKVIVNSGNSDQWNSAYNTSTVFTINSASYATRNFTDSKYLPLSGGSLTGPLSTNSLFTTTGIVSALNTQVYIDGTVPGYSLNLRNRAIFDPGQPLTVDGRARFVHGVTFAAGIANFTNGNDHTHVQWTAQSRNNWQMIQNGGASSTNRNSFLLTTVGSNASTQFFNESNIYSIDTTAVSASTSSPFLATGIKINYNTNATPVLTAGQFVQISFNPGAAGIVANTYSGTVSSGPNTVTINGTTKFQYVFSLEDFSSVNWFTAQKGTELIYTNANGVNNVRVSYSPTDINGTQVGLSGNYLGVPRFVLAEITGHDAYAGESVILKITTTSKINLVPGDYNAYVRDVLDSNRFVLSVGNAKNNFNTTSGTTGGTGWALYKDSTDAVHMYTPALQHFYYQRFPTSNTSTRTTGGNRNVALGNSAEVDGDFSYAFGYKSAIFPSTAGGSVSAAAILGGENNYVYGNNSTAVGGQGLVVSGSNQFVTGKFNAIRDTSSTPLVVGWGTSDSNRSNLLELTPNQLTVNTNISSNATVFANIVSAPTVSVNNISGNADETVFTDGSSLSGNGTSTLTMNYQNGIFVNSSAMLVNCSVSSTSLSGTHFGDGSRLTGLYQGTDLKALSSNWQSTFETVNTLSANWQNASDALDFIITSTNFNAIVNRQYLVDTTISNVVGILPLSPAIGDNISFVDSNNTWASKPLILNNNGNLLQTYNEPLTANISGYQFKIVYIGGSYGWKIV